MEPCAFHNDATRRCIVNLFLSAACKVLGGVWYPEVLMNKKDADAVNSLGWGTQNYSIRVGDVHAIGTGELYL